MMFLPDVVLFYPSGILSFENKTNEEEQEAVWFTVRKSVFAVQYDLFNIFTLILSDALP